MEAVTSIARRDSTAASRDPGRLGAVALRNELAKLVRRPAAMVTVGFMILVAGLDFGQSWWAARRSAEETFALPAAWPEIVTGMARPALIFGSVLLILLVASKFSWRTARQNVIDGLSKEAWFRGKAYLVLVLAFLFLLVQLATGAGFAAAGTDTLTLSALLPGAPHVSAMGGFLLAFLGYGGLALLAALSVRGTGASIGVWFMYAALGERLIRTGLGAVGGVAAEAGRYLPVQVFNSLVRYGQHDPGALATAAAEAGSGGGSAPQVWQWEVLLPVAAGWVALFFAVSFVVHRRRDL